MSTFITALPTEITNRLSYFVTTSEIVYTHFLSTIDFILTKLQLLQLSID